MKVTVIAKFQFEGLHYWPLCPHEEVEYLKHPHRHVFFVEAEKLVSHDDRDTEFIMLKHRALELIQKLYPVKDGLHTLGTSSCEQIAKSLIIGLGLCSASVFEDNENGAKVYK